MLHVTSMLSLNYMKHYPAKYPTVEVTKHKITKNKPKSKLHFERKQNVTTCLSREIASDSRVKINTSLYLNEIQSLSPKQEHVRKILVLTGWKHDMLGSQTFEVLQPSTL